MVDCPIYRLLSLALGETGMTARFAVDRFAHYALTYDLLEQELVEAVASSKTRSLPLRLELRPDARFICPSVGADRAALVGVDFSHRLCAGGVVALLAIARRANAERPADFFLVVQRRSRRTLNVTGRLAVIPKAFHQHLINPAEEVGIGTTLRRELEEELFSRTDIDEGIGRSKLAPDPFHPLQTTEPMQWLEEHQACAFYCVAVGVNLLTGNYEFASLITIYNEDFWVRFGGACLSNWEAAELQTYSSLDTSALDALIRNPYGTDEGLFAFIEGLRALDPRHPERVQIPELEVLIA